MKRRYLPDMTTDGLLVIAAAMRRHIDGWWGDADDNMSADETRLSRAYDAIYAELERRGAIDNLPACLDAVEFVTTPLSK